MSLNPKNPESQHGTKVEELSMMSENVREADFKEKISLHVEVLLQFALWLTKNGRDAVNLLREAMAEAYRSWDDEIPEGSYDIRLHKILTRQFFSGRRRLSSPIDQSGADNIDVSLIKNNRLFLNTTADDSLMTSIPGKSDNDVNYFRSIASLPQEYRSVMILSYLEGFTNVEIAKLAGVQPHAIEAKLNRGRRFLRDELFAHLMRNDNPETAADQVRSGSTG